MAYTIKIRLREQYIKKDGKTNFQLVVYINRTRKYYPVDVYIEPKYWNGTKILATNVHNKELNKAIKDAVLKAENCFVDLHQENKEINFENFEENYFGKSKSRLTVAQAFEEYIKYYSGSKLNKATIIVYKGQKAKFIEFAGSNYLLENINQEFYMKYRHFLLNEKKNVQNTVVNALKKLKAIINFSIKMGYIKENKLLFVSEKYSETNRESLTHDELILLEQILYSNVLAPKLQNVLVLFLFSCYTGIRFSDIQSLTKEHIKNGYIVFVQKKIQHETKREISIPIGEKCQKLIEHYSSINQSKLFHTISNQKANDYLKLIFLHPAVNLSQNITFHSARHTFAMLALDFELPMEYLQQLLGHSDLKTTKIYGKYQKELLKKVTEKHLKF